jgi:hypothetical protein
MVMRVNVRVMPVKIPRLRTSGFLKFGLGHESRTDSGACGLTMVSYVDRIVTVGGYSVDVLNALAGRRRLGFNPVSCLSSRPA